LVGDGDERRRLERLASDLEIGARVTFVGSVPRAEVVDYARAADLFLFPSTSETQGLAALEALAAGLPVVAVVSEAAQDLLQGGDAGVLSPEEPTTFARCIVTLWEAPERRAAMALAARQVAARFNPEACAARLLHLYGELIHAHRGVRVAARTFRKGEARP
jgi:glycosyltransferase involved in cell wall biosynthesis